jgi:5-methylcytosine-specific restriction endonuclease McrA
MFEDLGSDSHIKREKAKARLLRKTSWWQHKIAKPVCYYCQKTPHRDDITMDHIVPLSRGGLSTKGNIALACKTCNNNKKYYSVMEWDEYLKGADTTTGSAP